MTRTRLLFLAIQLLEAGWSYNQVYELLVQESGSILDALLIMMDTPSASRERSEALFTSSVICG